ncbi:MAG: tetratricopeptide repeat protein [Leptospirillia bacterium]
MAAVLLVFAAGCATLPPPSEPSVEVKADVREKVQRPPVPADHRAYYHFMRGYQLEVEHRYAESLSEYLAALTYQPESRDLLLSAARLYLRNGDLEGAIETAETVLGYYPSDPDVLNLLSSLYLQERDVDRAGEVFRQLIALDPGDVKPYYLMTMAYLREGRFDDARGVLAEARAIDRKSPLPDYYAGRIYKAEGNSRKALAAFKKAMGKDRLFEASYLDSAALYESQGRADKAIRMYEKVVREINPRSFVAREALIQLYLQEGNLEKVLVHIDGGLEAVPRNPNMLYRKATLLAELNRFDEAIDAAAAALAFTPSNIRTLMLLGSLYLRTQNDPDARRTFHRVLELDPDYYQAHINLGYIANRAGDQESLEREVEAVGRMMEKLPEEIELYLFVGWGHMKMKRFEEAAATLERAATVDPGNTSVHFSLGTVYYELKRHEDVVREMRAVIKEDPRHAGALNFLGYSYAERGERLDEAVELVKRALKEEPDNGYFLDSLSWSYYMQGRYREALKIQRQAIEKSPEKDPVLFEHLGSILLALEKPVEAREAWVKALTLQPDNEALAELFRDAGFGDPEVIGQIVAPGETIPGVPTITSP